MSRKTISVIVLKSSRWRFLSITVSINPKTIPVRNKLQNNDYDCYFSEKLSPHRRLVCNLFRQDGISTIGSPPRPAFEPMVSAIVVGRLMFFSAATNGTLSPAFSPCDPTFRLGAHPVEVAPTFTSTARTTVHDNRALQACSPIREKCR